jgi:glycosyltransferase involved in cell wall biosynthesis
MKPFSKSKGHIVYLIASQARINHRLKGILSLKESFEKIVLVTRAGPRTKKNHITIRPYYNPLGLFRVVGLHQTKKNLERYFFFPSTQMQYVRPAVKWLKKSIDNDLRNSKSVSIITSLPPHDLSIVGLSLKSYFPGIHWIVDWQDLWSWDEYYFDRVPKFYRNKLINLELKILANCDVNVTTNIKAKKVLEKQYQVPPERTVAINHHFYKPDIPSDLQAGNNRNNFKIHDQIKIGFLGMLFKPPKVPGSEVVAAIQNLKKWDLDVEFHIFGDNSKLAREAAYRSKENSIVLHPPSTHKQSLLNISKCHFLLLALSDSPNSHVVMHSKLPHYLLLKRPILAIVPPNSFVAQLINETGSGYVIPTESIWERQLENIIKNYCEAIYNSQRNEKEIEKYAWENISKCWLQVMKGQPVVKTG